MNNFWQNKRVLVIGGSGFIGRHFVKHLNSLGAKLTATSRKKSSGLIQLDPSDSAQFAKLNTKFDVLINCAALDGNGFFKKQFAKQVCDTNVRIALNVLKFAEEKKIEDCVLFSSAEVYTGAKKKIVAETDLNTLTVKATQGYQTAKLILELLANFYQSNNPQMRIYLPRPSYVYGPGDKYIDEQNSRLIPMLIHKISNRQPITFYGGRSKLLNMIYVEDLVEAVLKMVESQQVGALNVTASTRLRIDKIIKTIAAQLGQTAQVSYQKSQLRPGFLLNNQKLLALKDQFLTFEDGIKQTLKSAKFGK